MLSLKNIIVANTAAIALLFTGGVITVANAQDRNMPPQGQQQQQMTVTPEQLEEFSKAQAAVVQVQSQFQKQAQGVESPEKMQSLQQQANEQMVEAVQHTGISVQEYNQIANLIQNNPQVRQRYIELTQ